jgi:hypothetical protein
LLNGARLGPKVNIVAMDGNKSTLCSQERITLNDSLRTITMVDIPIEDENPITIIIASRFTIV